MEAWRLCARLRVLVFTRYQRPVGFEGAIRRFVERRGALTTQADSSFIWGRGGHLICWWWSGRAVRLVFNAHSKQNHA